MQRLVIFTNGRLKTFLPGEFELEVLGFISGSHVNLENDILMDYDGDWFILILHVYRPIFQVYFKSNILMDYVQE